MSLHGSSTLLTHITRILVAISSCLLFAATNSLAANGSIAGKVSDAATGELLVGVSIHVENTTWGAASTANGEYLIPEIPPGVYTLNASYIGYRTATKRSIRVTENEQVHVDFLLTVADITLEGVLVNAPVIDVRRTTPKTTLAKEDIESLPLRSLDGIIAATQSVFKGIVRGGKQYETKTLVDGIDITDQFYAGAVEQSVTNTYQAYNGLTRQVQSSRSSLIDINISAIDQASVLTGTTGSDYGSATAGVISYSLRAPNEVWSVRMDANISQAHLDHIGPRIYNDEAIYFQERANAFALRTATDSAKARRYTYTAGKYAYGALPTTKMELSAGGRIGGLFGLHTSFGYLNSNGRLPNEFLRRINASVKTTFDVTPDIHLNAIGLLEDRGRLFGWKNRDYADDFRYFLEGVPQWDGVNVVASVKLTHVLSMTTLYEVQASVVRDLTRRGFSDDNGNGIIEPGEDGSFLQFADTVQVNRYMAANSNAEFNKFFSPSPRNESGSETTLGMQGGIAWKIARPGIFYERFVNSNITVKGDFLSQIHPHHLLKTGAQLRLHDLDRTLRAGYIGGVFPSFKNYVEEIWNIKPKEYSLYAEDRMEFPGLFLNIGFRLDGLDLSAGDYANYFAPFRDDTIRTNGVITDLQRLPVRADNAPMKWFFSPRVGVSHPISEIAAMYFSFSRQQQSQPFSRLYSNYRDIGNPSLPVVVRTNQDPIRSTNYDFGVQWAFADNVGIDINAFYKDIENYGTIAFSITPRSPWKMYRMTTNFGYADSRGIEIAFRKNISTITDWLKAGGNISYSHSYIKQAVYAGGNVTSFSTASDSGRFNGQLPFDDIRSFNTFERNVLGGNSTLTGGYDRAHRVAFNLICKFPLEISLTAVGGFQSGFYYALGTGDPRARELDTSPWTKRIDLRVEKAFTIENNTRIGFYCDIMNAFNWTNILAYNTTILGVTQQVDRIVTPDGSMVYDIPREVYFGLNLTF